MNAPFRRTAAHPLPQVLGPLLSLPDLAGIGTQALCGIIDAAHATAEIVKHFGWEPRCHCVQDRFFDPLVGYLQGVADRAVAELQSREDRDEYATESLIRHLLVGGDVEDVRALLRSNLDHGATA